MEPVSEEQKIKEWQIQANKRRAKALRRERYFYCLAVFVFMFCLVLVASVISLIVLGIIEVIHYLGRLEFYSSLFLKKTEGKPPVHDQPERRSIIWIDILILKIQDEDIDPYKNPSGLVVVHQGLLGSKPRG